MKQSAVEKTSIAWFKLAECIERGEKERAFNLHRLLMHSHGDDAYRKKLEADLLVFFDKKKSLDYYTEAILLYKKNDDNKEVVFITEQIIKLFPEQLDFHKNLIILCQELKWHKKAYFYMTSLVFKIIQIDQINNTHTNDEIIELYICQILEYYLISVHKKMDQFLSELLLISPCWHQKACIFLMDLK